MWNERDPNAYTFCGGDPIDHFDSNGKCVENAPPVLNFAIEPVTQTSLEATTYFQNGTSATTGLPGQPDIIYDPSQVSGNSYNVVTQPTGQYQYYIGQNALPANCGQTTVTPVSALQIEQQQNMQAMLGAATVLATVLTDTEESAPDFLPVEGGTAIATRSATTLGETKYLTSFTSTGNSLLDTLGIQNAEISDINVSLNPNLTGTDLANVTAHENFHVAVAQNFPNFAASSGRWPYIGAFPLYAEEVGAYGYGAISAGQYSQALLAPVSAFQSLSAGQTISVLGTGAAAGGLIYYNYSH